MSELYVGLMSGTSTDGVDGVLADLSTPAIQVLASHSLPMPDALRACLLALNTPGPDELARAARAALDLSDCYASVTQELLSLVGMSATDVRAIGAHGQTVRHAPQEGYTIQVNAPARLAELTGIAVVADFRSRDVAAGGQGAPLVPAFHAACFGQDTGRTVLNLGGIANITILDGAARGFDTGPANMLMDAWIQYHLGQAFDHNGTWASRGHCIPMLLDALLAEPWFALPPPKSTGRDLFNLDWLQDRLKTLPITVSAVDVQATLLQLSAITIADAIARYAPGTRTVLACGGGALNPVLMQALAQHLPCPLGTTQDHGVPVMAVEALAFAWLAQAHVHGQAACWPAVTGARHASIAGCLYPA